MAYEQCTKLDAVKLDRTIKSLIGMSRAHFDILAVAFAVAYDAVQLDRLQQGEIQQVPSGGPKGYLDTFDKKLFFLLYYSAFIFPKLLEKFSHPISRSIETIG